MRRVWRKSTSLHFDAILAPLLSRLRQLVALTDNDAALLDRVQGAVRNHPKGHDILFAGDSPGVPFVVLSGAVIQYRVAIDGRRQISELLLPGSLGNIRSVVLAKADCNYESISKTTIVELRPDVLLELMQHSPRIAMAVISDAAIRRSVIIEHLMDIGVRTAYQRLAHFLLETLLRCREVDLPGAEAGAIPVALTQPILAESLGLSTEHVSRTLRRLSAEKLIERSASRYRIIDTVGLAAAAGFDAEYLYMRMRRRQDGEAPSPHAPPRGALPPWRRIEDSRGG